MLFNCLQRYDFFTIREGLFFNLTLFLEGKRVRELEGVKGRSEL